MSRRPFPRLKHGASRPVPDLQVLGFEDSWSRFLQWQIYCLILEQEFRDAVVVANQSKSLHSIIAFAVCEIQGDFLALAQLAQFATKAL
jgi:hypothetical protein